MPQNDDIPFYSNTPDDTHCFQATLRMVLKYFMPEQDFSWKQLDKITAKQPGMWTWPMAGLCWLTENGFDIVNIESFDYQRFCIEKEDYLIEKFGADIASIQAKNSVLPEEVEWARKFLSLVPSENRLPAFEEVISLASEGYLVIVNLNARALNQKKGYVGHFVIVVSASNDSLAIHDPGLPAYKNRIIARKLFMEAWDYPDKTARNLIAIKPAR
jgi:hypothetical protein